MAWIGIIDRSAMNIVPAASASVDEEILSVIKNHFLLSEGAALGNTKAARAMQEKKAIVCNDLRSDATAVFRNKFVASGIHSMAIFPIVVADESVGMLALYAGESEFFRDEEMKLLTNLAGDISFALEHIGKEETIARLSRIRALTSGINAVILHVRDPRQLFSEACRIAVEIGGFGIAWIGLLDQTTLDVIPAACAGVDANSFIAASLSSASADKAVGKGLVGQAFREKRPVFSNDITAEPGKGGARREEAIRRGYRSVIALPLVVADKAVGTLALFAKELNFFTN
jgi:diguanylate cyclase